jgi:transcriptional regulator with XRE-family HTH domain
MTETEWLESFGDNLGSMLYEAKMTQKELAAAAGLSEASISSYLNKRKLPSIKAIVNISYALDCDFADLIDFGDMII